MARACISDMRACELHVFDRGTPDAQGYKTGILELLVVPLIRRWSGRATLLRAILMQGNAPIHRATLCIQYIRDQCIPTLPWPS